MSQLVRPHGGGELLPLLLQGEALAAERARAQTMTRLRVSSRERGDILMLGIGGFTPLDGFMTHADWQGVCDGMRTASGLFWPIPITLSASASAGIRTGQEIALEDPDDGSILATMLVTEVYAIDNACPHAEGPLAEGDLQGSTVYCPWHGWAFDLPSGRCRQGAHVRSYPTRVVGDEVQVDLSGTRGPD